MFYHSDDDGVMFFDDFTWPARTASLRTFGEMFQMTAATLVMLYLVLCKLYIVIIIVPNDHW